MKQSVTSKRKNNIDIGYLEVNLTDINGNDKRKTVHLLVAQAFIPNPQNKPTVNHKDGNKHNNNVENLEWMTYQENSQHAFDQNIRKDKRAVIMLDKNSNPIKEFSSIHEAGRHLHINFRNIHLVCNGKRTTAGNYKWKYKYIKKEA